MANAGPAGGDCTICLEVFTNGAPAVRCGRSTAECSTLMHKQCYDALVQKGTGKCPGCRHKLTRRLVLVSARVDPAEAAKEAAAAAAAAAASIAAARSSRPGAIWEEHNSRRVEKGTRPEDQDPDGLLAQARRAQQEEATRRAREEEATQRLILEMQAADAEASGGGGSSSGGGSCSSSSSSSAPQPSPALQQQQADLLAKIQKKHEQELADAAMAKKLSETLRAKRPRPLPAASSSSSSSSSSSGSGGGGGGAPLPKRAKPP